LAKVTYDKQLTAARRWNCDDASGVFHGMMEFVFDPPLRLAREVTVRTLLLTSHERM